MSEQLEMQEAIDKVALPSDKPSKETKEEPEKEEAREDSKEKVHEPPPDHPRFAEVYARMNDFKREAHMAKEEIEELKNLTKTLTEQVDTVGKQAQQATGSSIDQQISAKRKEKRTAMENSDYAVVEQLEEEIDNLREQKREMNKPVQVNPAVSKPDDLMTRDYNMWITDNPQFKESDKWNKIVDIDKELSQSPDWGGKWHVSRWNEAARLYSDRYESKPPSADSVADPSSSKKEFKDDSEIELTEAQKRVAKALGVSEQDYKDYYKPKKVK